MKQLDLLSYDRILVAFSGGKDSVACFLHVADALVEAGLTTDEAFDRIELWHHDIDGREPGPDGDTGFMDWPVTPAYCRAVAEAFRVPIFFSWKQGGFEREMLREQALTAPTMFEVPDGTGGTNVQQVGGTRGTLATRRRFPQVSANLSVRWCSAYLKIDIMSAAIRNQDRFNHIRTLVVTGERGEESTARAKYADFEPHRADGRDGRKGRHIDHWRPVKDWLEADVWAIMQKHHVNPHPAYWLGWGRVSCMACIFGSKNQWASVKALAPDRFAKVAGYEQSFGCTIQRTKTVEQLAAEGTPYEMPLEGRALALSDTYSVDDIFVDHWVLPPGAFAESCGPT